MKTIVHCIFDKELDSMTKSMVRSVLSNTPDAVSLVFHAAGDAWSASRDEFAVEMDENFPGRMVWKDYSPSKMPTYDKIATLKDLELRSGDQVVTMDTDMIAKSDVTTCFKLPFDWAVTTRHYKYWYVINTGFEAFRWNSKTRKFLDFYLEQMTNPTWEPYVKFRQRFHHPLELEWFSEQDFFCAVWEHYAKTKEAPLGIELADLGPAYNYCPSVEQRDPQSFDRASMEIRRAVNDPDVVVLHYKGRLKEVVNA